MSSCLNPQKLYNKYLGRSIWTSCRKCSHCMENQRQQWKFRLMCEKKFSSLSSHLTLQFDDDHIGDNVLDVAELQKYFKRLRSSGLRFTYYAIGEYGTRDKRKHYHIAFFLKSHQKFDEVKDICIDKWKNGYIYFTKLHYSRMGYILHYHVRPKEVDGKKTLAVQSKGLGLDWLDNEEIKSFLVSRNSLSILGDDGAYYTFPRYYKKKFDLQISTPDDYVPSLIDSCEKRFKRKFFDIPRKDLLSFLNALYVRDQIKIQNYNTKSN